MLELNKIYNMDCLEGLKQLEDNSVDLVITDPPYGDNFAYRRNNKSILNNESVDINFKFLELVYSKLKENKTLYIFTNYKFLNDILNYIVGSKYNFRQIITMVKNNFGMGYGFRNQIEFCVVVEKGTAKYNLNNFSNYYKVRHIQQDENTHPHQKDDYFINKLIEHSSLEGELVLDGFCGSGSTLKAAKQLKRKYIGFELDEKWYKHILNRLKQNNLFEF